MFASPITVAILAGGAASRLGGRDKGLEPLHGRALVEWVLEALARMDTAAPRPAMPTPVAGALPALIVANRHLDVYARYARTVSDQLAGFRGPLAGVASALAACATPWLLTLPVDCPDPPHDLARRLGAAAQTGHAPAWVAHDGERRQPLFALYRRELAASAASAAAAGQGVWQWQTSIGAHELDFSDCRRQFQNLNTPEEFAAHVDRRTS